MNRRSWWCIALVCLIAATAQAHDDLADDPADDQLATAEAIGALLASANEPIVPGSSCDGVYVVGARASVLQIVANGMAALDFGRNRVRARCRAERCDVGMFHADGEWLSATVLHFRREKGRAVAASLECEISP